MKAVWKGTVVAESDETVEVEGNHYFPPEALNDAHVQPSAKDTRTTCGWKGEARYYDVVVNGEVNADAAWFYPDAKPEAVHIEGYVAFWNGVTVED